VGYEVLQLIYSGKADDCFITKKKPRATQDARLAKEPLRVLFGTHDGLPLLQQLSRRIPISNDPLNEPYSNLYCLCSSVTKPSPQIKCIECNDVYCHKCLGYETKSARTITCGFCEDNDGIKKELKWEITRKIFKRGKRKKDAPTHETIVATRSAEDHIAGPSGRVGYRGPTTWEEEVNILKKKGEENRLLTKQYKDSAKKHAKELEKNGGGHHVIDQAVGGQIALTEAPMDDALVEQVLEDKEMTL
jgi:hypothetical protein